MINNKYDMFLHMILAQNCIPAGMFLCSLVKASSMIYPPNPNSAEIKIYDCCTKHKYYKGERFILPIYVGYEAKRSPGYLLIFKASRCVV